MRRFPHWALLLAGIVAANPVTAKTAKKAVKSPVSAKKVAAPDGAAPDAAGNGPKVGQKAPDFTLIGADEKSHTLSNYRGRWVVLNFYPADFTKGCTAQACGLRDKKAEIEALNAEPISVSVQDVASKKKFSADNSLNFPVLADDTREVAKTYDVLSAPGGVARRYSFYIDPMGTLRKVDPKVQPFSAAQDVLANLKALQKDEPKPSLGNAKAFDQEIAKYLPVWKKNPQDKAAASELSTALYLKGRYTMLDTWLDPELRNPAALALFSRALEVNPNLVAAREDKAKLESQMKTASG